MATIDMRGADESFGGDEVGFGNEAVAAPTAYVWHATGVNDNNVYLYGTGIAASGGAPSAGTIGEIRIDLNGDGFLGATDIDITITGVSLPLVDLAHNDDLFWETVLQGRDTIHVFNDVPGDLSFMFGDGLTYQGSAGTTLSDDTLDATGTVGNVQMWGDYKTFDGASVVAGDDSLISASATGRVSAVGDFEEVRVANSDVAVTGGDDTIEIASGGNAHHLIGDVETVSPGGTPGHDIVVTGGDDTIRNLDFAEFVSISGDVKTQLSPGAGVSLTVIGGADEITGSDAFENIAGDVTFLNGGSLTGGNDFVEGGGGDDEIAGDVLIQSGGSFTGGDDVIEGGGGDDVLYGDVLLNTGNAFTGGNDIIDGGTGDDIIDGQTGNDTASFVSNAIGVVVVLDSVSGGTAVGQGNDLLLDIENVLGSTEDDTVTGNDEDNMVLALDGDDTLSGLGGDDILFGYDDDDTLSGGEGDDTLDGGAGSDWIDYSAAANAVTVDLSLVGSQDTGEGLDSLRSIEHLIGSEFDDTLTGSATGNRLRGLAGLDTMTGGAGIDKFDFDATSDSGHTNVTADLITDFDQGSDLIDLRTIDAKAGTAGNQAFTFIGTANFSSEGQVRYGLSADGATTIVQSNTTDNAGIDMTLRLNGDFTLTEDDFLL